MSDRDFKPGGEIIISIPRKNTGGGGEDNPPARRTGIIETRAREEYSPRRRRPTGGFVNFYDLGEYLADDGATWIDDARLIAPTIAEINQYGNNYQDALTDAAARATYNKPLSIALENWSSRFRKIPFETAFQYRLKVSVGRANEDFINTDNPHWTAQGLKIPSAGETAPGLQNKFYDLASRPQKPNLAVYYDDEEQTNVGLHDGIFQFFQHDNSQIKITRAPDYNAPAVVLDGVSLSGDLEIFVNRVLLRVDARRQTDRIAPNGNPVQERLNMFYTALPRAVFGRDDLRTERAFNSPLFEPDFRRALFAHPDARQIERTWYLKSPDNYDIVYNEMPLGDWTDESFTYGRVDVEYLRPPGALLGAIRRGDDWFFYWQN